jgi:ferredoxin
MSAVTIRINDSDVSTQVGFSLLRAIMDAGIPIDTACGGQARCHLCRVTITDGRDRLEVANAIEHKALGNVLIAQGMRLACQVEVTGALAVTVPEPRPKRRRGPPPPRPPATRAGSREQRDSSERSRRSRPPRDGKPTDERRASGPPAPADEGVRKKRRRRRRRPRRGPNNSEGT